MEQWLQLSNKKKICQSKWLKHCQWFPSSYAKNKKRDKAIQTTTTYTEIANCQRMSLCTFWTSAINNQAQRLPALHAWCTLYTQSHFPGKGPVSNSLQPHFCSVFKCFCKSFVDPSVLIWSVSSFQGLAFYFASVFIWQIIFVLTILILSLINSFSQIPFKHTVVWYNAVISAFSWSMHPI